jgi:hypothetical protein
MISGRSTACIFFVKYSVTFSLLSFFTATVNDTISLISRLSSELSKNRTVKNSNPAITSQSDITAIVGLIASITQDKSNPMSEPIQYVMFPRASTRAYSLGFARDNI